MRLDAPRTPHCLRTADTRYAPDRRQSIPPTRKDPDDRDGRIGSIRIRGDGYDRIACRHSTVRSESCPGTDPDYAADADSSRTDAKHGIPVPRHCIPITKRTVSDNSGSDSGSVRPAYVHPRRSRELMKYSDRIDFTGSTIALFSNRLVRYSSRIRYDRIRDHSGTWHHHGGLRHAERDRRRSITYVSGEIPRYGSEPDRRAAPVEPLRPCDRRREPHDIRLRKIRPVGHPVWHPYEIISKQECILTPPKSSARDSPSRYPTLPLSRESFCAYGSCAMISSGGIPDLSRGILSTPSTKTAAG